MAERTREQWLHEVEHDQRIVLDQLRIVLEDPVAQASGRDAEDRVKAAALALKEARRVVSDIYRAAAVAGIARDEIDAVPPL